MRGLLIDLLAERSPLGLIGTCAEQSCSFYAFAMRALFSLSLVVVASPFYFSYALLLLLGVCVCVCVCVCVSKTANTEKRSAVLEFQVPCSIYGVRLYSIFYISTTRRAHRRTKDQKGGMQMADSATMESGVPPITHPPSFVTHAAETYEQFFLIRYHRLRRPLLSWPHSHFLRDLHQQNRGHRRAVHLLSTARRHNQSSPAGIAAHIQYGKTNDS